jgi:hypothetical protein
MNSHSVTHPPAQPRSARLWIVESLIVLGVVAFGYFALTLDTARLATAPAPAESFDPIAEFIR